jgi:hypothetical protein
MFALVILFRDGILEEVIAIDHSGDTTATEKAGGASPPVSPTSARKYEMSSLLLDSVWPNVVEAVRLTGNVLVYVTTQR